MGTKYSRWLAAACFVFAGCAQGGTRTPILGADGGTADASTSIDGSLESCDRDEDCADDGNFCNGSFRCFANRCVATDIPNCNDGIACTRDECDVTLAACVNAPVSTACPSGYTCRPVEGCVIMPACEFDTDCEGDGLFCNGDEVCAGGNCVSPSGGRSCDDTNSCTADGCSDETGACVSMPHEFLTDPAHCGPTGENDCVVCPEPPPTGNAVAVCVSGACDYACLEGFSDRDGLASNFCESNCVPTGAADVPDDSFIDTDCDGVDGEVARAIFVSPTGSNGNDGFSPTTPVATISRAFDIARGNPSRVQILLQTGSYGGLLSTLSVPSGVGLYGGYGVGFMSRTDSRAAFLASASPAFDIASVSAPTVFDHVNVTVDARTTASAAAIGLLVRDSGENFTLRHSIITAGAGGNGGNGTDGTTGSAGSPGNPGSGETRGTGGSPGGGNGATGARQSAGAAGSTGAVNGASYGGAAGAASGAGGLYCNDGNPSPGGDGGLGGPGREGMHGLAGSGVGSVTATGWSGASAAAGQQGFTGGGGGGGGAGAGEDCTDPVFGTCLYCGTGRGGGGGGGGGYGGYGGGAGGGGGASIAVILSNSTLSVFEVTLRTLGGGNGGTGASGGGGGGGGGGAAGATSGSNKEGSGGAGGAGGSGGRGGCGGGGAGGPSVALWGVGSGAGLRSLGTVTLSPGAGGLGGSSCTGGNAGSPGSSEDRLNVVVF